MRDHSKDRVFVPGGDVMLFAGNKQYIALGELVERLQKLETTVSELQTQIDEFKYDSIGYRVSHNDEFTDRS